MATWNCSPAQVLIMLAYSTGGVGMPPGSASVTVGHDARCLVVPFGVEIIDSVLQDAGSRVVVLGCHENESIEAGDGRRPVLRALCRPLFPAAIQPIHHVMRMADSNVHHFASITDLNLRSFEGYEAMLLHGLPSRWSHL